MTYSETGGGEQPARPWPTSGPAPCANHPDRETRVHCSNCGKPICPDCMVYTPVGIKCKECARLPRSALITLDAGDWAKAIVASFLVGTGAGFAYYFLLRGVGFFFLAFFIAAGIGWLVGEAVFRASGYYHGLKTALIAVAGTVWAFLFPPMLSAALQVGLRWDVVVFSLSAQGIINWIIMTVAGYVAWQRNR